MYRKILILTCILAVLQIPNMNAEAPVTVPDSRLRDLFNPESEQGTQFREPGKQLQESIVFSAPDDELIFTYENSALWSGMKDIYISGNRAFCSFHYGLLILDISDTLSPQFVSRVFIADGDGWRIDSDGQNIYLADGYGGLKIIDVSNIENPLLLGELATDDYCYDVRVMGQFAYIADGLEGLLIADISDPGNPRLINSYPVDDEATALEIRGSQVFLANGGAGLKIFDISNPENIVLVGGAADTDCLIDIDLDGDYAYLAAQSDGLQIIDISNPADPVSVEMPFDQQGALGVDVEGNYAYLSYGNRLGLRIFDISDPLNARLVESIEVPGSTLGVTAFGSYVFVAGVAAGLQIIDVYDPGEPYIAGEYATPGKIFDIDADADYIYAARTGWGIGKSRIQIVKYSESGFETLSELEFDGPDVTDLQIDENYLYLVEYGTGFHIVDVNNPENPSLTGSLPISGRPLSLHTVGETAFIGTDAAGLLMVDITSKTSPALLGAYNGIGPIYGIVSDQQYAYLADANSGLKIVDITDPQNPVLAGSLDIDGSARDLELDGDLIYLVDSKNGLQVINILDPQNPILQQSLPAVTNGAGIEFAGNYVYVSYNFNGLTAYGAPVPDDVYFAGSYLTPGYVWEVAVSGDNIFVADYHGLIALKQSAPYMTIAPDSLRFEGNQDGYDPYPQTFMIENATTGNLRWSLANSQAWLSLSPSEGEWAAEITATVTITGLSEGLYYDTIMISSNAANSPGTVLVELRVNPINNAPVLSGPGNAAVDENSSLQLNILASDEDGTIPRLRAENLPENSVFTDNADGSGVFEFDPGFEQAGEYFITFIAIDEIDSLLADSLQITITVNNVNRSPFFASEFVDVQINEDDLYEFIVEAVDPDADAIMLACWGKPENAEFTDSANGKGYLRFQSDYTNAEQTYTIEFTVSDSYGETIADTISLNVLNRQLEVIQVDPNPPGSGIKDVLISDDINVIFNEPVDATTLEGNVNLSASSGDKLQYAYNSELNTLVISSLGEYFSILDTITITISSQVTDLAGFPLAGDVSRTLITGTTVYPGDADNNGVVDERDLLPLGVYWNSGGPARIEGGDCSWAMSPAHQWEPLPATYADADGSGIIDADDICGISENWGLTHGGEGDFQKSYDDLAANLNRLNGNVLGNMYSRLSTCPQSEGRDELLMFLGSMTGQSDSRLPVAVELYQNYPNPFNPITSIQYAVDSRKPVRIDIFDIRGRHLTTLVNETKEAGIYRAVWNGTDNNGTPAASGIYFYRLKTGDLTMTKKMILLK
ncbi:MAG TPA: T9SS type A sorting domain-containing protein [candidate division Zixibacteria bacterium]|nr:T9SS type A sorting domain-containing protein [candidate division Zixibacteria bacterium]